MEPPEQALETSFTPWVQLQLQLASDNRSSSCTTTLPITSKPMSAADGKHMYLVHCLDDLSCGMVDRGARFGGSAKRMAVYAEHKKYQGETSDPADPKYIHKIAAGPLESEDGKHMVGSSFILYCTREEAERFNQEDIFHKTGVWGKVTITRWVSIPNGVKPVKRVMDGDDLLTVRMVPEE